MKRKLSEYDRQNISTRRVQAWETYDHENAGHDLGRGMGHISASQDAYKYGSRVFGVRHDQGGGD